MAKNRKKIIGQTAFYHVMSRTVNGEALFGGFEKEVLRKMIWQVADFSGVEVVTYAIMNNHFHILVRVPSEDVEVSDRELVRRYKRLYPKVTPWQPMSAEALENCLKDNFAGASEIRKRLVNRMHDVSEFMKTLKLRFSLWFNRAKGRFGPLWSDRFKSVLVEGERFALRTVAAYIDLNPVRAGLVRDPKDYRFCGYAQAVAGSKDSKRGLANVDRDLAGYRQTLFGFGSSEREEKCSIAREEAVRVLQEEKGSLPLATVLRCRVRYLTDGVVLGSESFVERFSHPKTSGRKSKARPMHGADWRGLRVGNGLKNSVFG